MSHKDTRILWADSEATRQADVYSKLANEFGVLMLAGTANELLKCLYVHGERLNVIIISTPMSFDEKSDLAGYRRLELEFKGIPPVNTALDLPFLAYIVSVLFPRLPIVIFADAEYPVIESIKEKIKKAPIVVRKSDGIDALINAVEKALSV
ncbi:MAG: hypothetical protein WC242_02280 [Candidatus Paceibacterota bacterium]|jgi:hypothetical protein